MTVPVPRSGARQVRTAMDHPAAVTHLAILDGIPITDTIADTFAAAPDPRAFRSVEVSTSNIPAEYGNKLAGVIAVTTRSGLEIPQSGSVTLSGGSFSSFETSFDVGGHTRKFGYFASAAGSTPPPAGGTS